MPPTPTDPVAAPVSPWWLIIAVAACLPVCVAVFWRIGRWWITEKPVPLPLDGALPVVRWPAWAALVVFVGLQALAFGLVVGYDAAAGAGLLPWEPLGVPEHLSPGLFAAQVVPLAAGLALVRAFGRGAPATVGVRWGRPGAGLAHGVVAFAAILPVCVAALLVNMALLRLVQAPIEPHPLLEAVQREPEAWTVAAATVQAVVLAPLAEEFLYRGLVLVSLLKPLGPAGALVLSSLLFASVHLPAEPQAVLPLFFLGMALGYAAYRTRSLVAPVLAHALFNALMVFGVVLGAR